MTIHLQLQEKNRDSCFHRLKTNDTISILKLRIGLNQLDWLPYLSPARPTVSAFFKTQDVFVCSNTPAVIPQPSSFNGKTKQNREINEREQRACLSPLSREIMGSEHLFKYPFYMMNWLWCWLYPCDGAEHALFIVADLRVELKWFPTTLGQLDSFGNAKVVILLPMRAAVKFTKEGLILATEGHKLDSENEPRQRATEQWTKRETPKESLVVRPNEARLQVNKCTQHMFTSPCDGESRVGEVAVQSQRVVTHSYLIKWKAQPLVELGIFYTLSCDVSVSLLAVVHEDYRSR